MNSQSASSSNSCADQPPRGIRKRVIANKRERERTKSLNQALETLRNRLPVSETEKRSKIQTLRMAKEYIEFLSNLERLARVQEKAEKFDCSPPHNRQDQLRPRTASDESMQYERSPDKCNIKLEPSSPDGRSQALTYMFYKFRLTGHS